MNNINHTIQTQDGTLYNFKRRFKKKSVTLLKLFNTVKDRRRRQGIRHSMPKLLLILFVAITEGLTTIKEARVWATNNRKWLAQYVDMKHGIPDETTIARALEVIDVQSVNECWRTFVAIMYNSQKPDTVASFDGKSIKAIHNKTIGGHIVSLFTHGLHQIVGQVSVKDKSNELKAAQELLNNPSIAGLTVVGDALHTQKETISVIRKRQANYFLFVKANQQELMEDIAVAIDNKDTLKEYWSYDDKTSIRDVRVTVEVIQDKQITNYIQRNWTDVAVIGRVRRVGQRREKEITRSIDETVYFISSKPDLTAQEAAKIIRGHWCIENNLHWQKDYTFLEDRQRLRRGNAPAVMTLLRSCCIALFKLFDFASVSTAISNFNQNEYLHHKFLNIAAVV